MSNYKVSVPEGQAGDWRVERFTVSVKEAELERLRAMFSSGRGVPTGTYTRLTCRDHVVMSDTPDEIRDHISAIYKAKGNVLINGLGLGMVLQATARKQEVEHVTVIEKSPDVIALVAPHYQSMFGEKIEIVLADAFEYKPPRGVRYGAVWHDIWNDICSDNLSEMAKLHRKYGRITEWQGSWSKELCKRYR